MLNLEETLRPLQQRHSLALQWFAAHAGNVQPWPSPLSDGTILASKAKGIYKPQWTSYALSVRQSLAGPYPDHEPVFHDDGTWSYLYYQENPEPSERDTEYTNIGLMNCYKDSVPIGILRQVVGKPNPKYQVLGLAFVAGWETGYFFLEGFNPKGFARNRSPRPLVDALSIQQTKKSLSSGEFDINSIIDSRERSMASIVQRRGQPEFRRSLLGAYGGMCAVTRCDAEEALEACHIVPYMGTQTNHPSNGLLLRADVHTLFDLGMLAIDVNSMTILVSDGLRNSVYGELEGKHIHVPREGSLRPARNALEYHRKWSGL